MSLANKEKCCRQNWEICCLVGLLMDCAQTVFVSTRLHRKSGDSLSEVWPSRKMTRLACLVRVHWTSNGLPPDCHQTFALNKIVTCVCLCIQFYLLSTIITTAIIIIYIFLMFHLHFLLLSSLLYLFCSFITCLVWYKSITCINQLKFDGVICLRKDSNPPNHALSCSHAWVLNACFWKVDPSDAVAVITKFGAGPSVGAGLHQVQQRVSVLWWFQ